MVGELVGRGRVVSGGERWFPRRPDSPVLIAGVGWVRSLRMGWCPFWCVGDGLGPRLMVIGFFVWRWSHLPLVIPKVGIVGVVGIRRRSPLMVIRRLFVVVERGREEHGLRRSWKSRGVVEVE